MGDKGKLREENNSDAGKGPDFELRNTTPNHVPTTEEWKLIPHSQSQLKRVYHDRTTNDLSHNSTIIRPAGKGRHIHDTIISSSRALVSDQQYSDVDGPSDMRGITLDDSHEISGSISLAQPLGERLANAPLSESLVRRIKQSYEQCRSKRTNVVLNVFPQRIKGSAKTNSVIGLAHGNHASPRKFPAHIQTRALDPN
jgi:hypothetical protein